MSRFNKIFKNQKETNPFLIVLFSPKKGWRIFWFVSLLAIPFSIIINFIIYYNSGVDILFQTHIKFNQESFEWDFNSILLIIFTTTLFIGAYLYFVKVLYIGLKMKRNRNIDK